MLCQQARGCGSYGGTLHPSASVHPPDRLGRGRDVHRRERRQFHLSAVPPNAAQVPESVRAHNPSQKGEPLFRFWHDEKRFKGDGLTSLAQRTLIKLGGQRKGGNIKSDPSNGQMGWEVPGEWDVLWSPSSTAQRALSLQPLLPNHCVNAVLGSRALTRKKNLGSTLRSAYGSDAFSRIMPTTFEIPSQLRQWIAYLKQHKEDGSGEEAPDPLACGPNTLWVLKTAENLGKGIRVVEQKYALKEFLERAQRHMEAKDKKQVRQFLAVQRYVENPLLINGCKFGLRVWVAVTSVDPLRVYLHSNGLVLFSSKEYDEEVTEDQQGHLTNYAQNVDGEVWDLGMLLNHVGLEAFTKILAEIKQRVALTFAAAAGKLRASAACHHEAYSYELFGLDFLVDDACVPWLLEVNATPSLAVEHQNIEVERMIHQAKAGMIADLFSLVRIPGRYTNNKHNPNSKHDQEGELLAVLLAELDSRAGFEPLMHLLPSTQEAEDEGWRIALSKEDEVVRSWFKQQVQPVHLQAPHMLHSPDCPGPDAQTRFGPLAPSVVAVEHMPSHLHHSSKKCA
ncbi:tubulin-tyrosine ligase family-domain-containing protein [Dunaliella salina]|uniref:Tubulin--tyrosine ligase-like protein 5 n=1 Tax=Dunaliella salina TaxID=3046 RepID=A0ABQ7G521_DUNSA|nr:tubulin-tyrosine ligase family-domain-containing protein [Dunaliella salina]|eukprot:KAF5829704.1 tubulin-tyrosine ligase family-domain-containing protein [Dunaliella salina]